MIKKNIAILPGDGIGPEIMRQAEKVLTAIEERFGHKFVRSYGLIGACAIDQTGQSLPHETLAIAQQSDATLLGAIGHPKFDNDPTVKVRPEQGLLALRKEMGLFANIRPINIYEDLRAYSPLKPSYLQGVDFVIYRELTGGAYFGDKRREKNGTKAVDEISYEKFEIVRIAELAFKAAVKRSKKLTLVDKANVLESSRLWRETVQEVAKAYPEVDVEMIYVDNAAMQIIQNPRGFDIVLTENMFGDILSDAASVLTGSIGLLPSSSIGNTALFEPIHGSYPQAAGKNIANPIGMIRSVAMMFDHWDMHEECESIEDAVSYCIKNAYLTPDLKTEDAVTTELLGDLIAEKILDPDDVILNQKNIDLALNTFI